MTEIRCQTRFVPRASLFTQRLKSTLMAIRHLCGRLLEVLTHAQTSILAVAPLYPTCTLKHTLCDCTEAIDTPHPHPHLLRGCCYLLPHVASQHADGSAHRSPASTVLHRCILSFACRLSRDGGLTSNKGVDNTNTHKHEHSYLTGELGCFVFVLFLLFYFKSPLIYLINHLNFFFWF